MLREASLLLLGVLTHKAIRFISHSLNNGNQRVVVDNSSKGDLILSQTVSPLATNCDVFLSFRGEDTRQTFASYLYEGLHKAGIHTFMDHELRKGEQISPVLLRTIEESQISVIIFSENYGSSTWCMDELVHILECKEKFGRIVIPIFYKIHPSNIRKQNGSFGNGFDELTQRFKGNKEILQKWEKALIQSAGLSGWDSNGIRPECKLVEEIVKDILSKLKSRSSSHLEGLVGVACHIENMKKYLTEAHIVGIWGMGGAGKTTLAKAIFHEVKDQFDAFSFIENVKEQLCRIGLHELQRNCLKELLRDGNINNICDIKSTFVKSRLQHKKVLLVLDDVDDSIIAEDLIKVCDWFGEGSKIIITSRDMQVLKNASAFSPYHVSRLDCHDSFHLFCLKAFKQHEPSEGYMELSKSVVKYCQGNPLALVVLGCFFYGRGKEEWESALEKLKQAPPKNIIDVMKLSFDGLDDKQQDVFLDLAFFIKERVDISLTLITQLYGSSVDIELRVLREKSLISFTDNGDIMMHDLMMKVGLEIDRQHLFSSSKSFVRLWRHEDIYDFFSRDKEIQAVRCLSLDLSKIRRIRWRANNFGKMHNLIFLKVYKSDGRKPSKVAICGHLDYLSEELRLLIWEEYPLPYVPLHFCAENLITLEMPNSNIRQLWHGNQHFPNLKKINLENSKHVIALPDLSGAPNIEYMGLNGCVNLSEIHSSIFLDSLSKLWVENDGPRRINIGGNIKGTRSGLVMVLNHLNLDKLSFNKVRMEVLVCGNIICGVRFKHVVMPLEDMAELRCLLPFLRVVELLESSIGFGDDFNQHYDYDCDYTYRHVRRLCDVAVFTMKVRRRDRVGEMSDDDEEREMSDDDQVVEGPLTREMIDDKEKEMSNDDQVMVMSLMEVEQEKEKEDDDDDELIIMESCGNNTNTSSNIFTRIPNSITRWSLLIQLRLQKSDIVGNAGSCSIGQEDSILKSLSPEGCCKGIAPPLELTLSPHIPPSSFRIFYNNSCSGIKHPPLGGCCWFWCYSDYGNYAALDPNHDFVVQHAYVIPTY